MLEVDRLAYNSKPDYDGIIKKFRSELLGIYGRVDWAMDWSYVTPEWQESFKKMDKQKIEFIMNRG